MYNKTYRRKTSWLSELPMELLKNILCRLSVKTIFLQVISLYLARTKEFTKRFSKLFFFLVLVTLKSPFVVVYMN